MAVIEQYDNVITLHSHYCAISYGTLQLTTLLHVLAWLQEFIAHQIDTVFTLNKPLAALQLRFNIYDGLMTPSGRLCWHLTLLGCTVLEGMSEQSLGTFWF